MEASLEIQQDLHNYCQTALFTKIAALVIQSYKDQHLKPQ